MILQSIIFYIYQRWYKLFSILCTTDSFLVVHTYIHVYRYKNIYNLLN